MKKYILFIILFLISCDNNSGGTTQKSTKKIESRQPEISVDEQINNQNIYQFKGVIINIINDKQQMLIKHDEVPDFMMEMTMIFNIDSLINMNDYTIGDSLNFNFYVLNQKEGPAKTWASELNIVGHRDLREEEIYDDFFNQDGAIQTGEALSNGTFQNFNGEEVELNDWNGKFRFISFIFSRCPMPNFCPAVILKNQYLINQFKDNDNIEFVIISFDHKYDRPEVLKKAYGNIFSNYNNIHFLSSYGYKEDIIKLTIEAGVGFSGIDDGDPREIGHTLQSLLIDPSGTLISNYGGDSWDPKEVENNINNKLKAYGMD